MNPTRPLPHDGPPSTWAENGTGADSISADMSAGDALGANGTPTFFINGRKLVGALPFDSFKQVIDAELASKLAKK